MDITLFQKLTVPAEAERGRVYDDATGKTIGPGTTVIGNPTIAIGRNVGPTGPGIRESEMFSMLANDEDEVESEAKAFAWYPGLNLVRQTVVCCMIFNMGLNKFDGFTNLKAALAAGNWQRAHDEMLSSRWAEQPPIGVGIRAENLAAIMLSGLAP
jgi:GH24 family phage-related lysozyme (muramidase)